VAPPVGAAPLSVTVPVELFPPVTLVGLNVTDVSVTVVGFTLRVAVRVVPSVPEIVTGVEAATALVVTLKVAPVAPAATVTVDPTWADGSLLESATTAPPVGAAPLSVTVPVELFPPVTLVGLKVNEDRVTGPPLVAYVAWYEPTLALKKPY